MSTYLDGFMLSVSKRKLAAYRKIAQRAAKVWREYGAIDYREFVGDQVSVSGFVAFPKMAKTKPGEAVVFSYAIFKSRKHRDAVNKRIMGDPRIGDLASACEKLFDCKRMAYGGFKSMVG
ncbi:MAG TPA: DUF1428 domain-containing protein [Verrucomicrobiaceae bacterium]|jgi:uncharacterized protein YbaA (DUF1428 family)